jgi:uncharacterized protein YegP (UPF0339 family)
MHYRLYKDTAGLWRWRLVASNGRTIADSAESYYNKSDALAGINLTKSSYSAPVYE